MTLLLSTSKGRIARLTMRSAVCALAIFCLAGGVAVSRRVHANGVMLMAQKNDGQQKGKAEKTVPTGPAVLWQEPTDIESRDLIYGIGGRAGAPDPAGKFTFLGDKGDPNDSNPKIDVKDEQGRFWTVKFGPEVKAETAATRIVWAVGYHVDQDYFVEQATIEGFNRLESRNMRFEREDDGWKKVGRWDWNNNAFVGTREFDGLKTLMALLHNVDLAESNTKIVRRKGGAEQLVYYVNDLGASLGSTGAWFTKMPWLTKARSESKGVPKDYVKNGFIAGVKNGEVDFQITRRLADQILDGVKVEHARWMGNLLARLSEKQLKDAFQGAGFTESEVDVYVNEIRDRIKQLQNLESGSTASR
ncbi:MAG TPA: hypothetical protein VJS64_08080 [Pyrinomonadaceae bacterium]|nr:hypothetical protein [Pyrinomonadaceae bacterium]